MTDSDARTIKDCGYAAGHIRAICRYLASALQDDPNTAAIGEAVDGVGTLADRLSDQLLTLGFPDG